MGAALQIRELFPMGLGDNAISDDASIAQAVAQMRETGGHSLLVRDADGRGVGVLSEHDIVTAFAVAGDDAKDHPIKVYMTLDLVVTEEEADLDTVIKLMAAYNIRHMPVVSEFGHVVSFLSVMDLLMAKISGPNPGKSKAV